MTRAVLDANVFVSAVLTPTGTSGAVLEAWRSQRFALFVSPAILREVARVLVYPKVARRHGWSRKQIQAFVRDFADFAVLTPGEVALSVIRDDPDDDRYLECAVEGHAEHIVSGDQHLLALGAYEGITIVTPRTLPGRFAGNASAIEGARTRPRGWAVLAHGANPVRRVSTWVTGYRRRSPGTGRARWPLPAP